MEEEKQLFLSLRGDYSLLHSPQCDARRIYIACVWALSCVMAQNKTYLVIEVGHPKQHTRRRHYILKAARTCTRKRLKWGFLNYNQITTKYWSSWTSAEGKTKHSREENIRFMTLIFKPSSNKLTGAGNKMRKVFISLWGEPEEHSDSRGTRALISVAVPNLAGLFLEGVRFDLFLLV